MPDDQRTLETTPLPDVVSLVKADFIGTGRDGTEIGNAIATPDDQLQLYASAGAIAPPLDLLALVHLFEMSGALRTNVDSYVVNIDGHGHRLVPVIDIDSDKAPEKVKAAMMQERILGIDEHGQPTADRVLQDINPYDSVDDPGDVPEPSTAEITTRVASIRREMAREKLTAEKFFTYCAADESFAQLRKRTRQDIEVTGNGYWEVLRNRDGAIVQFGYVAAHTVRLMPLDRRPVQVMLDVRATPITPAREASMKRLRRFVQVTNSGGLNGSTLVFFKELGDPRVLSCQTGVFYASESAMRADEPDATPATELIHFKIHSSRSAYGVPRWISEMLSVVGSRHADEVNANYFDNKSVPPLAILVSGGRLIQSDVKRLESYVANEIRGKKNFHKIMILQAESADQAGGGALASGKTRIDIKPLTDAQSTDAQFLKYREANTDAVGAVFRLPRLLRGDARDFNRATAQASLEFAEKQVFGPMRHDFDFFINRVLLPLLGINFWLFESRGPDLSDPSELLKAVNESAARGNYLTPAELRRLASRGFGVEFDELDEDWTSRPIQLTLGGITTGQVAPSEASRPSGARERDREDEDDAGNRRDDDDAKAKEAALLISIAKRFATAERDQAEDALNEDAT